MSEVIYHFTIKRSNEVITIQILSANHIACSIVSRVWFGKVMPPTSFETSSDFVTVY